MKYGSEVEILPMAEGLVLSSLILVLLSVLLKKLFSASTRSSSVGFSHTYTVFPRLTHAWLVARYSRA